MTSEFERRKKEYLESADVALLAEGEKIKNALSNLYPEHQVFMWTGEPNSVESGHWSPFEGRKVIIFPNDASPGFKAAIAVAKALESIAKEIMLVPPPHPAKSWDMTELDNEGWTRERAKQYLDLNCLSVPDFFSRFKIDNPVNNSISETSEKCSDENIALELQNLARLSKLGYDQARKGAAQRLGVSLGALDAEVKEYRRKIEPMTGDLPYEELMPWDDPVDGAELIMALCRFFEDHAILPNGGPIALALWCLNTYVFDASFFLPILLIDSPEKRCGKSTVLNLVHLMSHKAVSASNITPASLFRANEKWKITFLIDEADTFLKGNEEIRGMINSGHSKSQAFVIRTVGENHEPRRFSTWGPKVIAMIGEAPDTLLDRSIRIRLRRKMPGERIKRINQRDPYTIELQQKCLRWAEDNFENLGFVDVAPLEVSSDRAADNWSPLLGIAELVGLGDEAREAAKDLMESDVEAGLTASVQLLMDIQEIFSEKGSDRMASVDIVNLLNQMEDRPWPECNNGRLLTPGYMARLLKPFGIRPRTLRIGAHTIKGYDLQSFEDAFARYIPKIP